jgi:chemotaxis protein CheC
MFLSETQRDAITEILNIGFSKSASALSELTGYRILLSIPEVKIIPVEDLGGVLSGIVPHGFERIATVHQIFSGPISGDAMLILSQDDSKKLTNLLLNTPAEAYSEATMKDVLSEVGNILINSCMGMFGNILKIQITFTVPQLQMETFDMLLRSLMIDHHEISYALMVAMKFQIRGQSVSGYMILILGVTSLDQFLAEVEKLYS